MGIFTPRWAVVAEALEDDTDLAPADPGPTPATPPPQKLHYDAAARTDRTRTWLDRDPGPQTITEASPLIRARSRDLCRNNPHGKAAVARLTSGLVGSGIRPQVQTGDQTIRAMVAGPRWKVGKSVRLADYLEWLWDVWQRDCYRSGSIGAYGVQSMVVRGMVESGGALLRKRITLGRDGYLVPLQLQVIEDDFLDHAKTEARGTGQIVQGVELDLVDRVVAYWLHERHPNDARSFGSPSIRTAASDIIYLWDQASGRPGQVRGVPWLASVALALKDLDTYADAEVVRRQVASCLAVLIQSDEDLDGADDGMGEQERGKSGRDLSRLKPGLIGRIRNSESITVVSPPSAGDYAPYLDAANHRVAAGAGVTYEDMTGELSKVNYSSIRYGTLGFRRWVDAFQEQVLGPVLMDPMWRWFLDACSIGRLIPMDAPVYPVEWQPQQHDDIDALKERTADARDLANGTTSIQRIIRRRGGDPEQIRREIAEDMKWLESVGLKWPGATPGRIEEDEQGALVA